MAKKSKETKWSWRWTRWTNAKWAECFECDVEQVGSIKESIKKNYYYTIFKDEDDKYGFYIYRLGRYPDGDPRPELMVSLSKKNRVDTPEELKQLIEDKIFPNIEFSDVEALFLGLPSKSLRLVFS